MAYRSMVERAPEVFSEVAEVYDEVRPAYPAELYERLGRVAKLSPGSRVLEVGGGTGVATEQILAAWNPSLTVLEPGPELFRFLRRRFRGRERLEVVQAKFEDFKIERKYDVLLSATAFHWVERKRRFLLADGALKAKGFLVLYWNNYSRNDDPLFDEIQTVYKKYYPVKTYNNDIRIIQRKSIADRVKEVARSGLFKLVLSEEFHSRKKFSAAEYVKLLKTFSKNASRSDEVMRKFYEKMEELILARGGSFGLPIHTDLIVAKKARP